MIHARWPRACETVHGHAVVRIDFMRSIQSHVNVCRGQFNKVGQHLVCEFQDICHQIKLS